MEKTKISSTNQFNPLDILALSNFSRVKTMIDETMYGEVSNQFEIIAGGISQKDFPMTQLRHHDRYIYLKYQKSHIWIGLGYWMNSFNKEREYPELRFVIEVSPKSPKYKEVKEAMEQISLKDDKWIKYNLDIPKSWAGIYINKSLRAFMHEDDHIESIKKYFLKSMEDYEEIKDQFKGLI